MARIENGIEIYNTNDAGLITSGRFLSAVPTTANTFAAGCILEGCDGKVYTNAGSSASPSFQDINSISTSEIADGAITLAKMANMATASVIYRKTAATGVPEVNTLATLKTDLGLTGTNSGDQTITLSGVVAGSGTGAITTALTSGTPVNAVAAKGTITLTGIPVADETFVVDTQTFTFKALRGGVGEVTIGIDAPATVTNIVDAITADLATVTAVDGAGDTVVVTAATKGVAGNSIIFTENATNVAVDGTGTLGATVAGVDGTVGGARTVLIDSSYIYFTVAANTIADNNWRRVTLGSAY